MRRLISRLALLTAFLMIIPVPVLAADGIETQGAASAQQNGKVSCLALNTDCRVTLSYPDKIEWIQSEINRGTAVYSKEELNLMRERLNKTIKDYEYNMLGGGR